MKSGIFTIALLAVLAAPAWALATDFTWNGNTSAYWDEPNWSVGQFSSQNYPGQSQNGDSATIKVGTNNPVILDVDLYELSTLDMDADTAGANITLDIRTGADLDTSGLVTVKSDLDGTYEAKIIVGATFTPYAVRFWGRNHASDGHAKADADVNFVVDTDVSVRQYADFDVASGKTVTVNGTLRVGKDLDDYFGYLKMTTGTGTLEVATLIVEGDTGAGTAVSTLEIAAGTVKTK